MRIGLSGIAGYCRWVAYRREKGHGVIIRRAAQQQVGPSQIKATLATVKSLARKSGEPLYDGY
eukprot:scaffold97682_cov60-Attheya_sp.AAC.1